MSKQEFENLDCFWSIVQKPNVATDDHLQSLGLDMSNELPKFKFNEPGPTALATSIFQKNNMVNDETDQSFIVLSKSSLEDIRDASLASYMEIQQKSSLTDPNSLMSMMSPIEIQENLKKVLEENIKLKEILKKNNYDIKQQFNTISKWQKEVMTVCDNHKQKFLETKDLISRLKKENNELQEKITKIKPQETFSIANATVNSSWESNIFNLSLKKSNYLSTEDTSENSSKISNGLICADEEYEKKVDQLENEQDLKIKIDSSSNDLVKAIDDYTKAKKNLSEYEQRYVTYIELFSNELQKSTKELETFKQKSDFSYRSELQMLVNKCCEKDLELQCLKEIIVSLEQQITKLQENSLPLIDLNTETNEVCQNKLSLNESVEIYNSKLKDFEKHFASQCSSFLRIQEFLKESAVIIQIFENSKVLPNNEVSEKDLKGYKDKLSVCRKKLIEEQLKTINDKQITVQVQKQLQKIFSELNSIIYEMEILKDENLKLTVLQAKSAEDNALKLSEIEMYLEEEKKNLEYEKTSLLEEKLNLQIEKRLITGEKTKIETDRNSLASEKENLFAEKTSLSEEKTSLDRQSKLYENQEATLLKEKKILQKKCDDLATENDRLKEELNNSNITIQQLQANNCKLRESEELISAYKIQTEMHLKEFEDMHNSQKNMQDQLQSLSMENLKLRTENDRLGGSEQQQNLPEQPRRHCGICSKYIYSIESHGYGICSPEFD